MIYAKVLLKTVNERRHPVVTFELQFPRIILPEVLTHRTFSRNTASHRAQPFNIVLKQVQENPFIPYYWQKEHKGMQGKEYFTQTEPLINAWLKARDVAVENAVRFSYLKVSKQLSNRILEPFTWVRMIVTTGYLGLQNFFNLRRPRFGIDTEDIRFSTSMAEVHIQILAEEMYKAYNKAKINHSEIHCPIYNDIVSSVEACARISYNKIENSRNNLFEKLLEDRHMSPFEHVLFSSGDDKWYYNMLGYKSLRYKIEKENYDYRQANTI